MNRNRLCLYAMLIVILLLSGCTAGDNSLTGEPTNDSSLAYEKSDSEKFVDKVNYSFLDSIANKYELSVDQIRTHTQIDSIYYTGIFSDVGFTGDTVFDVHSGLKGAIIGYDDRRSCQYKFLLVMTRNNKNITNKIIYSDCDQDESANYVMLNYKLLNDSIFETSELYIPKKSKPKKIQNLKWKISNRGGIELLP